MRIRISKAQLTPGVVAKEYKPTTFSQIVKQEGIKTLVWGHTPELELVDPGWTTKGAFLNFGDKLSIWNEALPTPPREWTEAVPPITHYASIVLKPPFQTSVDGPLHVINLGTCGLVLVNGNLGWRVGDTVNDLGITPPDDLPLFALYEMTPTRVRFWFNNSSGLELEGGAREPTEFTVGNGAAMEVYLVTLHVGMLPSGGAVTMYKYARRITDSLDLPPPEWNTDTLGFRIIGYDGDAALALITGSFRDWAKTWPIDKNNYTIHFVDIWSKN